MMMMMFFARGAALRGACVFLLLLLLVQLSEVPGLIARPASVIGAPRCLHSNNRGPTRTFLPAISIDNTPDAVSPSETVPAKTEQDKASASLSVLQRIGRALSFYSTAVPLFATYKGVSYLIQFKRALLQENVTEDEATAMYEQVHDWGSDAIVEKINELKGFYVKVSLSL